MTYWSRLANVGAAVASSFGGRAWASPGPPQFDLLPPRKQYEILNAFYFSNNLYANVSAVLQQQGIWSPAMKPLRNPTYRVVESYAAKVWGGPLDEAFQIETANPAIIPAIEQVWAWSNWGSQKQHAIRMLATTGDWFAKVATRENEQGQVIRVYLQNIKPEYVSDFSEDERGFITYIRLDIPRAERDDKGKTKEVTHTEVWDKSQDRYRLWVHDRGIDEELDRLGTPQVDRTIQSFGIDFIPFCHAMLRDVGNDRGMAAIWPAIEKINEADMQATRLHQMLFRNNRAFWASIAGGADPTGRPLPPVKISGDGVSSNGSGGSDTLSLGDDDIIALPGTASLQALVPNINYGAALDILNAMMDEIEHDLPELAYYSLRTQGQVSGVAVRLLLSDAIDRWQEARGNAFSTLIQADQMALTLGERNGLEGFAGIGTFESGSFDHQLIGQPFVPPDAAPATGSTGGGNGGQAGTVDQERQAPEPQSAEAGAQGG
jgi:hypothetical protein